MRGPLRRRIETWADGIDPTYRSHASWLSLQLGGTLALLALAVLAAFVPGSRDFFRLEPWVPLGLLVFARAFVLAMTLLDRRRSLGPAAFFAAALGFSFLEELVAASFLVYAQPPGAFVLATLPILRAASNAITFGAGLELPHLAAAHGLGIVAALALRPDAPHAWLLALVAPLAVGVFLLASAGRTRFARERARERVQRRAIEAHELADRAEELRAADTGLIEAMERGHDLRSSLAAALLRAEVVLEAALDEPRAAEDARAVQSALVRVREVLDTGRRDVRAREAAAARGAVPVAPVLAAVVEDARSRHRGVRLTARGDATAAAFVAGGEPSLRQVLAQLVENACAGDERGRARGVRARVEADPHARAVAIEVADDGPGFPSELLASPIAPFASTRRGAGLGLYTAERLVRASGGSLRRENRLEGGARVTVYFELAPGPAA